MGWQLEIVERVGGQRSFVLLPVTQTMGYRVIERTFARLSRQRRLSRDYERLPQTSAAFIYVAMISLMISLMISRLARL